MNGLIEVEPSATLTPNRRTLVTFDGTDTRLIEDYWSVRRVGAEVCPVGVRIGGRSNLANTRFWKSLGCWTMRPVIEAPDVMVDRIPDTVSDGIIYRPDDTRAEFRVRTTTQTRVSSGYRKPQNVDADAGAPASGDPGLRRYVPRYGPVLAGQDYLPGNPGPLLAPPAPVATTVVPVDAQAETEIPLPEDRACFLRFITPQQILGVPSGEIIKFHFAQYCLVVNGNGLAQLHERARPISNPTNEQWVFRFEFRFTANPIGVSSHVIGVYPFVGIGGGRYLVFTTDGGEEHLYTASDPANVGYLPGAPAGCVTRAGNLRVDIRRDFRPRYIFGPVLWFDNATMTDQPVSTPQLIFNPRPLQFSFYHDWRSGLVPAALNPTGEDVAPAARSGQISIGVRSADGTNYAPPNYSDAFGQFSVNFAFFGHATGETIESSPNMINTSLGYLCRRSPVLWGYYVWRDARLSVSSGSPFTPDMRSLAIVGDEGDPRQVKASIAVTDPMGQHTRLRRRSFLPVSVAIQWTPQGASLPIQTRVFSGYAMRNKETQHGKYDTETFRQLGLLKPANITALINDITAGPVTTDGPPGARQYPSPEWREYDCQAVGPWYRLMIATMRSSLNFKTFAVDTTAPKDSSGIQPPWKVTDAIKYMLSVAGFESDQIAIVDNPIRLFAGLGTDENDQIVDVNTNLGERCVAFARNYLGGYLIFDYSHGTRGAWKLLIPPPEGTPAMFHFTRFGPSTRFVPPHTLSAYPPNTAFAIGPPEGYTVKPEGNHLWIFTAPKLPGGTRFRYERRFFNHLSYAVPDGRFGPPDPESPHYIGSEELIVACFPELYAGASESFSPTATAAGILTAGAMTTAALNFVGRRIFNYACRARRIENLLCPLVFVNDGGTYRMLRFGDPVTLDGTPEWGSDGWFVRSCSVEFESDNAQFMRVELEKLIPYP